VCCSHCGTIGESNGVLGSDWPLVDTRGLMPNKVSGMPLAARVETSDKRLQAKKFVLFLLLVPGGCQVGLLRVDPPMVLAAFTPF
jgi:hypothetical protein